MNAVNFEEGDLLSLTKCEDGEWLLERNNSALRKYACKSPAEDPLQQLPCEPPCAAERFFAQYPSGTGEAYWERRYELYEEHCRKLLGDRAQAAAEKLRKNGPDARREALRIRDTYVE
jgi:hypothetical protein